MLSGLAGVINSVPRIIQGGMGAGISSWELAKAVSSYGQLGVVSGTALDAIFARRLQDGDIGGHMRRAADAFPFPDIVDRIFKKYYISGGKSKTVPYKQLIMHELKPNKDVIDLTILSNFAEVFLAKENHSGIIGINYLEKIQLPTLSSLFGAMLAGVDYVLMGAGIPKSTPGILDGLSKGHAVKMKIDVKDAPTEREFFSEFDPTPYLEQKSISLKRPKFLAIISSITLALTLHKKSNGKVDGFVVEGSSAGGHNAPPRGGLRNLSDKGEPLYGEKDLVDLKKLKQIGLPFWLAGSYADPDKIAEALSAGASGVQIGTAFAFCNESGMDDSIRTQVIELSKKGELELFTDPHASPTGFPIKIVQLDETVSNDQLYKIRRRICDLGFLRQPYLNVNGSIGYRCPGEPENNFVKKQGDCSECEAKKCLCNGLMATAGFAQLTRQGSLELPVVTAGLDAKRIARFLKAGEASYSAKDVIDYVLSLPEDRSKQILLEQQ